MAHLDSFLNAVTNGNEDEAEKQSQLLTADDCAGLMTIVTRGESEANRNEHVNHDLLWWAIRGLAVCGDRAALPALTPMLTTTDGECRAATLLAIAHIGQRMDEAERCVHVTASLTNLMAQLFLDENAYVRQAAADAFAMLGPVTMKTLGHGLATFPEGARVRIAYSLRKMKSMDAAPLLFQLLNDSNYLVQSYAYEALDELGLLDNVIVQLS